MEYVDGKNIADYLGSCPYNEMIDEIFIQLIDGFLNIETNGIIHRDIREGNILVDKNNVVKIIDFGLGKMFKPVEISSQDSMNDIINRSGLDLLPEEYFKGKYDSQTDMFYLAELFRRLLRDKSILEEFSYLSILEKMMKEKRKDRYASFSEVKEAIGQKDFSTLKISQEDKEIYQNFANDLYGCLVYFSEERQFKRDIDVFLKQLDDILQKNCLENVIQHNDDLLNCVIDCGYRYNSKYMVQFETVKSFRRWFGELNLKTQELVLNNISYKLSRIEIHCPADNIPF
jgi:serine/threonine-protein kinase